MSDYLLLLGYVWLWVVTVLTSIMVIWGKYFGAVVWFISFVIAVSGWTAIYWVKNT